MLQAIVVAAAWWWTARSPHAAGGAVVSGGALMLVSLYGEVMERAPASSPFNLCACLYRRRCC